MYLRWRGGRVAEGAPLLREYRVCSPIEGSNPSFSAMYKAKNPATCCGVFCFMACEARLWFEPFVRHSYLRERSGTLLTIRSVPAGQNIGIYFVIPTTFHCTKQIKTSHNLLRFFLLYGVCSEALVRTLSSKRLLQFNQL